MSKTCLYLDDLRTPTKPPPGYKDWVVVRDYQEFEDYILKEGLPDLISFDHDLGMEHYLDLSEQTSRMGHQIPVYELYKERTGLHCAKFLCDYILGIHENGTVEEINDLKFPHCGVHSANPVGAQNIQSYINQFKRHMGWEENCYIASPPFKIEENERI